MSAYTHLTLSIRHSDPLNMAPTTAKFLAYELPLCPISLSACLAVCLVGSSVMAGSNPAVNRPKAPPSKYPIASKQYKRHTSHNLLAPVPSTHAVAVLNEQLVMTLSTLISILLLSFIVYSIHGKGLAVLPSSVLPSRMCWTT